MKIITITLNPSIDKTLYLDTLDVNQLNRVKMTVEHVAGKGINVSNNLHMWHVESIALGFVGGIQGKQIKDYLTQQKIQHDFVEVKENTRVNLKIKTSDNMLTEINEPGPTIEKEHIDALFNKLKKHVASDCIVVLSGSAPPSLNPSIYKDIVEYAKSMNAYVILDVDKQALHQGLSANPNMIKPNEKEVQDFVNSSQPLTMDQLIDQAKKWIAEGLETIIISMGSKGALFVANHQVIYAKGLSVSVESPIGAGDSMVAAMVYAKCKNMSFKQSCTFAMAASAATVETIGTQPATLEAIKKKIDEVKLEEVKV